MKVALYVMVVLSAIGLIAVILFQSGRTAGLSGTISGMGESVFGKKKGMDELLAKFTGVLAAVFFMSAFGIAMIP